MIAKVSRALLSGLLLLTLTSCGKEAYVYVQKQSLRTDQSFRVKEMKGSSAVDLLWVIDNSGSMDDYQQQVISNANDFMKDFIKQKLNWKLGLISTDESDSPYAGFQGSVPIDSNSVDPVSLFVGSVRRLGTDGDGTEKTFTPILNALGNDPTFLRPNSPLAVIMVTDAQEQSRLPAATFMNSLLSLTGTRNIYAYGVFAPNDFGCSGEGWDYAGSPYEQFINTVVVGKAYPLCKDFATSLQDIAHDIVTRVSHTAIYLSSRPNASTLKVLYQDQPLPPGPEGSGGFWVYDYRLNAVVFNNLDFAKNDTDSVRVVFEEIH